MQENQQKKEIIKDQLDPRQIKFLELYLDINSSTFGNALQSGIKAGFSQEYSENITSLMPNWLSENIGDSELLLKAIRNLKSLLDENKDLKVKADITKFVAERLGKAKFSNRTELTGRDGENLPVLVKFIDGKNN